MITIKESGEEESLFNYSLKGYRKQSYIIRKLHWGREADEEKTNIIKT